MVSPKPQSPLSLCIGTIWRGLQRTQSTTDRELKGEKAVVFPQPKLGPDPTMRRDQRGGRWKRQGTQTHAKPWDPDSQMLSQPQAEKSRGPCQPPLPGHWAMLPSDVATPIPSLRKWAGFPQLSDMCPNYVWEEMPSCP